MRKIVALFLVAFALSMIGASVWYLTSGGGEKIGATVATLSAVFNDVQAKRARQLSFKPAEKDQPLFAKDSVKTGTDSRAVITYESGLMLNVDPDTLVSIAAPTEASTQDI